MKLFSLLKSAFQIYLYKGSQTDSKIYKNVMDSIQKTTNTTCEIKDYNYIFRNRFSNDTYLVGHSFGGYFSLLDALVNNDSVKGIVLVNSHFNSKGKAMYPGVDQQNFDKPVLTILGAKDERLPLHKSIWDYYEKNQQHFYDKYYIIDKKRSHFTGLSENDTMEAEMLGNIIGNFILDCESRNFSTTYTNTKETDKNYKYDFRMLLESNTWDYSWSLNIYDGIAKSVIDPRYWNLIHYLLFLAFKPSDYESAQFHDDDSLFVKTKNISPEQMITAYEKQIPNCLPSKIMKLPTIHPSIPVWLGWVPTVSNTSYQVVVLPINNETIYYKFPNPYRILAINRD